MNFASDNTGPVHPKVIEAITRTAEGYDLPYGEDADMARVRTLIRQTFEAPDAEVFLVSTGTAANALALSQLVSPWEAIFCTDVAHIHVDECGAPEFYSGGAKLVLVPSTDAKMTPTDLDAAIAEGLPRGLHYVQPGAVSVTQVTERGTVYSLDDLTALTDIAKARGLPVHMDGARFANATVALGLSAAEMSWKAGFDVISFGGTKNGLMSVEAIVFFDPARAEGFEFRRKRAAQLFSKHRFLSAQMAAYLEDELWRDLASQANAMARRLADGLSALPHAKFAHPVQANMLFPSLPRAAHRRAVEAGAKYFMTAEDLAGGHDNDPIPCRLVTNWATTGAEVDAFLALVG